jgi:Ca2+-binding RTX toxin-like protein
LLVVLGLLFVGLAAGDAVAGTGLGSFRDGAISIHGGSGEDALIGGSGDDEIYGLSGRDLLVGGAGDDFIEASDGTRDQVRCGPGQDVVSVDEKDFIARDCETVYKN